MYRCYAAFRYLLTDSAICNLGWPFLPNLLLVMVLLYHNAGWREVLEVSGPISLSKAGLPPKPDHFHAVRLWKWASLEMLQPLWSHFGAVVIPACSDSAKHSGKRMA